MLPLTHTTWLSLQLACVTTLLLLPLSLGLGRWLAVTAWRGRAVLEALVMLPLVLPPTVLGYYLLVGLGRQSWPGQLFEGLTGQTLVFSFEGLVLASWIFNLPFAIQPAQRAFAAIPTALREAAWTAGLSPWRTFVHLELPLAWPGVLTAMVLTFAHTLGEFGVVLMVGGNIPGETQTLAIAIYDRVQAFDFGTANQLALGLLLFAFVSLLGIYALAQYQQRWLVRE
ncbi:MAG: molybdate ABC transporter permease subunit [Candidatus Sericytochromatia bacterium]|nr:molybdate ABC transporter permease subunit [Candidatus Sericytochromatia bacterium]